jgi:VanZ family protein
LESIELDGDNLYRFASLVPGEVRPHTGAPTISEHIAAYLGAGVFLSIGYGGTTRSNFLLWSLLLLLAGTLETLQMLVPGRNPRVLDFLASGAGASLGVPVGRLLIRAMTTRSI